MSEAARVRFTLGLMGVCVAACVSACAAHDLGEADDAGVVVDRGPVAPEADDAAPLRAIVTIEARDHRLTVYATPRGDHRFIVADRSGGARSPVLTTEALARRYPALARQYESAYAGERGWVDASVDRSSVIQGTLDAGL